MKIRKIILIFILIVLPFFVQTVSAQPPPEPVDIPIDGGLGFLLLAGMAYGAKKIIDNRENDEYTT